MSDQSAQFACDRHPAVDHERVVATGEIDLATGPQLAHVVREAQLEARHVVLDLRASTFIDTSGVRVLLAAQARARATAGTFAIDGTPSHALRLLRLMGADRSLVFVAPPVAPGGATPPFRGEVPSTA